MPHQGVEVSKRVLLICEEVPGWVMSVESVLENAFRSFKEVQQVETSRRFYGSCSGFKGL